MTVRRQPGPPTQEAPQPAADRPRVGLWEAIADHFTLAVGVLLTIGVAVFVVQNMRAVRLDFLVFHGRLPVGVGMLLSAVVGALVVVIPGSVRIIQLRRVARRHLRR